MKAAVLVKTGEELVIQERNIPSPKDGEALARVEMCGVCTSDLMALRGEVTDYSPPVVMGHEIAATVVESRNPKLKVGERITLNPMVTCGQCVFCKRDQGKYCEKLYGFGHDIDGGYAEYMLIPEQAIRIGGVIRAPRDMPSEDLIFVEPLGCCLNAWRETEFRRDLVILGAGPIGLTFLKLAVRSGLRTAVFEPLSERRRWAHRLGADGVFGVEEDEVERFKETMDGGADTVIIATNNPEAIDLAFKVARRGAFLNFFGLFPKGNELRLELEDLHFMGYRLIASWAFSKWSLKAAMDELASGEINLRSLLTHVLPIERINEALRIVDGRRGMKVAIKP
ncbi:TPA: hypothetical protein ENG04_02240 [Candidatus Poribacteria bacterium]|nr:hypothetical protein [Candidatus Poribacteria bacterium]HEX28883.1 hypothetical protein [Candidatus Poribacteria bacterium]